MGRGFEQPAVLLLREIDHLGRVDYAVWASQPVYTRSAGTLPQSYTELSERAGSLPLMIHRYRTNVPQVLTQIYPNYAPRPVWTDPHRRAPDNRTNRSSVYKCERHCTHPVFAPLFLTEVMTSPLAVALMLVESSPSSSSASTTRVGVSIALALIEPISLGAKSSPFLLADNGRSSWGILDDTLELWIDLTGRVLPDGRGET